MRPDSPPGLSQDSIVSGARLRANWTSIGTAVSGLLLWHLGNPDEWLWLEGTEPGGNGGSARLLCPRGREVTRLHDPLSTGVNV